MHVKSTTAGEAGVYGNLGQVVGWTHLKTKVDDRCVASARAVA